MAIVLAAGRGRRLGGQKHLREIPAPDAGPAVPMLGRVLAELRTAGLPVCVVLGAPGDPGEALARRAGARAIFVDAEPSPSTPSERSASIRAGVQAAPDADGWLFVMADQPFVTALDHLRLIATFEGSPGSIVCASYAGARSTPSLFPHALRSELLALRGSEGGRVLIARHARRVVRVELPPEHGRDMDTPEDLTRAFGPRFGVDLVRDPATMPRLMERTLSIIKPDAVGAQNTGAILQAIEGAGLRIVALRMLQLTADQAGTFYAVHAERPFFKSLCEFMVSGPIVVSVLEGDDAISRYRKLMGATNPEQADQGTLRKRFASDVERNAVHGSDGPDTAAQEISFFFPELR